VGHLVVLAIAALFIRLGIWQLDRLDEVRSRNRTIEARLQMPAVPLQTLLTPGASFPEQAAYRRVTVSGTYQPLTAVVQFRALNGEPGRHVLAWLSTGDDVVLVNRGWVPASGPDVPVPPESAPAQGVVRLEGLVLPFENGGVITEGPPGVTTVTRIDPAVLPTPSLPAYPGHVQLVDQSPRAGSLPVAVGLPVFDEGPHLSYAVQWFLFTAIGLVGWPFLIRRSARDRARSSATSTDRAPTPEPVGRGGETGR
jgi:cytochrome oxidase assembly protein ShyY1